MSLRESPARVSWRCRLRLHRWTRYKDPEGELQDYAGTWSMRCRDCGRDRRFPEHDLSVAARYRSLALTVCVVLAGVVWVWLVGSLFGVLLIIGGVAALGVVVLPDALDRISGFLSTGSFRRR